MKKNNMFDIDGKTYYLDMNAITKWCLSSSVNPTKETEINEGYDTNDEGNMQMMTKVIRELKTNNPQDDTIRYDFIKLVVSPFLGDIKTLGDIKGSFSNMLLFNTLVNMGFLKEITQE
jgi:hypothetical protein